MRTDLKRMEAKRVIVAVAVNRQIVSVVIRTNNVAVIVLRRDGGVIAVEAAYHQREQIAVTRVRALHGVSI